MNLDINTVLQIGGAVASIVAAYTALGTKATMLELKLWVSENFERKSSAKPD